MRTTKPAAMVAAGTLLAGANGSMALAKSLPEGTV